jgi:hypothetical protein
MRVHTAKIDTHACVHDEWGCSNFGMHDRRAHIEVTKHA